MDVQAQGAVELLQIKMDNGPASSGVRTQLLHRMVQFADHIGKPIQLLYYPPYHRKYNPMERSGGTLGWDEAGRCGGDAGMGQEYDLEEHPSGGGIEPSGVSKRDSVEQESDAGG
jgi:hypothetical protein